MDRFEPEPCVNKTPLGVIWWWWWWRLCCCWSNEGDDAGTTTLPGETADGCAPSNRPCISHCDRPDTSRGVVWPALSFAIACVVVVVTAAVVGWLCSDRGEREYKNVLVHGGAQTERAPKWRLAQRYDFTSIPLEPSCSLQKHHCWQRVEVWCLISILQSSLINTRNTFPESNSQSKLCYYFCMFVNSKFLDLHYHRYRKCYLNIIR